MYLFMEKFSELTEEIKIIKVPHFHENKFPALKNHYLESTKHLLVWPIFNKVIWTNGQIEKKPQVFNLIMLQTINNTP